MYLQNINLQKRECQAFTDGSWTEPGESPAGGVQGSSNKRSGKAQWQANLRQMLQQGQPSRLTLGPVHTAGTLCLTAPALGDALGSSLLPALPTARAAPSPHHPAQAKRVKMSMRVSSSACHPQLSSPPAWPRGAWLCAAGHPPHAAPPGSCAPQRGGT